MTLVCGDCGSLNVVRDGKLEGDDWFSILVTLSDRVPTEEHCLDWLNSKGISDDDAEQTAIAMKASLRYDPKKGVWKRGSTEYVDIWRVFQSWCLMGLRRNGQRTGTPKAPRPRARVGAITRGDAGIWESALAELQLQVTRPSYETWLKDTVGLGMAGNTLVVGVSNEMVAEMLEQRMYSLIRQAVVDQSNSDIDVAFQVQT